jgi:hypothetical protein
MAYEVVKSNLANGTVNTKYRDTTTGKLYSSLDEYNAAQNAAQQANIQAAYQKAVAALTSSQGAAEQAYQTGKRKTLSDIAMANINAGMANTTNMTAAGSAYDQANRSAFNANIGTQAANLYSNWANTLANLYGTNLNYQVQQEQTGIQGLQAATQATAQSAANSSTNKQLTQAQSQISALQSYINSLSSGPNYQVAAGAQV